MQITVEPIAYARTDYKNLENMPIQPKGCSNPAQIEVLPEFAEGLKDLDGFSHIYLLTYFDKCKNTKLTLIPFMDTVEHGVFATRSPARPNHIGLSIVKIESVKDNIITVTGIDLLDGTPIIDIKPYIENFDHPENPRSGWMTKTLDEVKEKRSDDRFVD